MRRLQQLLSCDYVRIGDELYFKFKGHHFTGKVLSGGLIGSCTWTPPGGTTVLIFQEPTVVREQLIIKTFESLTDFTESCIQEKLDEYHTRYSSWKRVRHSRTNTSMETLWKRCASEKAVANNERPEIDLVLHEKLVSQGAHIKLLEKKIDEWKSWYTAAHPNEKLPITEIVERPPTPDDVPLPSSVPSQPTAQPLMLLDETGQYMVLQKMVKEDSEVSKYVQEQGLEWFAKEYRTFKEHYSGYNNLHNPTLNSNECGIGNIPDQESIRRWVSDFFTCRKRKAVESIDASERGTRPRIELQPPAPSSF